MKRLKDIANYKINLKPIINILKIFFSCLLINASSSFAQTPVSNSKVFNGVATFDWREKEGRFNLKIKFDKDEEANV